MNKKQKTQYNKEIRQASKRYMCGEFKSINEFFEIGKQIRDSYGLTDRIVLDDTGKYCMKYEKAFSKFKKLIQDGSSFEKINELINSFYFLVDGLNGNKNKPLKVAIKNNNTPVVESLLKKGANPNLEDPIIDAIYKNNKKNLILLLDYGADLNTTFIGNEGNIGLVDLAKELEFFNLAHVISSYSQKKELDKQINSSVLIKNKQSVL